MCRPSVTSSTLECHCEMRFLCPSKILFVSTLNIVFVRRVAHVFHPRGEDVSGRQTFNKPNGEEKKPFLHVCFGAAPIFFPTNIVSPTSMKTKPDAPFFFNPPLNLAVHEGKT